MYEEKDRNEPEEEENTDNDQETIAEDCLQPDPDLIAFEEKGMDKEED